MQETSVHYFTASATYVDLAKQDQAHSNEFTAGIFVGLAGAAFIAFLQELPRKERRRTDKQDKGALE